MPARSNPHLVQAQDGKERVVGVQDVHRRAIAVRRARSGGGGGRLVGGTGRRGRGGGRCRRAGRAAFGRRGRAGRAFGGGRQRKVAREEGARKRGDALLVGVGVGRRLVQVRGDAPHDVAQDVQVAQVELVLVQRLARDEVAGALALLGEQRLGLLDERADREHLLVVGLEVDALVVERLVKVLDVQLAPDLVPLALPGTEASPRATKAPPSQSR